MLPMKILKKNALFIVGFIILTSIFAYLRYSVSTPNDQLGRSRSKSIDLAGEYLQKQMLPSGKFIYWVDPNKERRLANKYNILRHMGSLYSLKMLEDFRPGSVDMKSVKKSLLYIKKVAFSPVEKTMMGVWSSEELSGCKGMPDQIKLGAAGLVLVGMCGNYNLIKEEVPLSELEAIGDFIIFMQKDDGGFYSKYLKGPGPDASWVSLYYQGEAVFGLVELYKLTKKKKYLDSAIKAMTFLYNSRKDINPGKVPADYWALIATDKILKVSPNIDPELKKKLLDHGDQVIQSILLSRVVNHELPIGIGAFHYWGKTTPTATRMEGLTAFYPYIRDTKLKAAADFLVRAQVIDGPYAGGWTRAVIKLEGEGADVKNHNRRRQEIRIDYVQHALSALIEVEKLNI